MLIRNYRETDFDQVLSLLEMNIPAAFAPEEASDFENYLKEAREDYFVVEESGRLIACGGINYFPEEDLARLSWDMVHPEFHGKGIGSQLVRHRIAFLKSQQIQEVQVRTSQFAAAFYANHGFETAEIVSDYWAKGFDLVDMRLRMKQ